MKSFVFMLLQLINVVIHTRTDLFTVHRQKKDNCSFTSKYAVYTKSIRFHTYHGIETDQQR